jgi:hypothetical protein
MVKLRRLEQCWSSVLGARNRSSHPTFSSMHERPRFIISLNAIIMISKLNITLVKGVEWIARLPDKRVNDQSA